MYRSPDASIGYCVFASLSIRFLNPKYHLDRYERRSRERSGSQRRFTIGKIPGRKRDQMELGSRDRESDVCRTPVANERTDVQVEKSGTRGPLEHKSAVAVERHSPGASRELV